MNITHELKKEMAQTKTPAMVLQELCVKKHFAPPKYDIIDSETGTHINRFDYQVIAHSVIGMGTGSSKQISKHEAALDALEQLRVLGIYDPKELPVQEFKPTVSQHNKSPTTVTSSTAFKASPNCIGPLKDLCFEHKIPEPQFVLINEDGPPHSKEFTYECCVASLKTVSTSSTKKLAKQLAAQEMLEKVKLVLPEIAASCIGAPSKELPAISELDDQVLKKYNETYGSIIPNKTCKIADYPYTIKKLMESHEKTYLDFVEALDNRNVDTLKKILDTLEVEFTFLEMQEDPIMVALILKIDTPFTTIGLGNSVESAKQNALEQAFEILKCFMAIRN